MNDTTVMWMEIIFDVLYLVTVWTYVVLMLRRQGQVPAKDQPVTKLFIWAFFLLAFGDTFHLGFRLWGFAVGGLETVTLNVFGLKLGAVGIGALATAVTMTFFYFVMVEIWRRRNDAQYGWFEYFLFAFGVARFVIMAFPGNEWNNVVPPQPMGIYRNIPLTVLGLGAAYLMLRDAAINNDRVLKGVGWSIIASFSFYAPVMLWVQKVPMLGMLMIPKTIAYVAVAVIGYNWLFKPAKAVA